MPSRYSETLAQQVLTAAEPGPSTERCPRGQGRVPVLFTAKAADMLWGTVQAALSGKRVLEGSSPWSDRLGEKVTTACPHPLSRSLIRRAL
jgi:PmbA protein